ncbi:MAG: hypothetical protein LBH45_02460 [Campylobacteraceae bacterium]|jgi:hypothetical protein|nr:hypothetical protein [Campylobacteraceae bacterium]
MVSKKVAEIIGNEKLKFRKMDKKDRELFVKLRFDFFTMENFDIRETKKKR